MGLAGMAERLMINNYVKVLLETFDMIEAMLVLKSFNLNNPDANKRDHISFHFLRKVLQENYSFKGSSRYSYLLEAKYALIQLKI